MLMTTLATQGEKCLRQLFHLDMETTVANNVALKLLNPSV